MLPAVKMLYEERSSSYNTEVGSTVEQIYSSYNTAAAGSIKQYVYYHIPIRSYSFKRRS
jgi:hypothetical protein